MSYFNTFITIAGDCPAESGELPATKRAKKPIHVLQYELLAESPYQYDHESLIFEVYLIRNELEHISETEKKEIWAELFSKGHPCLRASALTKRYGFGAHYNEEGKIAIYPMESEEYQKFMDDTKVEKVAAMRTKRK